MANCAASLQTRLTNPELLKLLRAFLGMTQSQLAVEMGTTQTSVGRWEAGTTPISLMTMGHVRALVTARIMELTARLFREIMPTLTDSQFDGLFSNPDAGFFDDAEGNLYLGSVFIDGYRRHTLHIRTDDRNWYGLDHDGKATRVDETFLLAMLSSGRSLQERKLGMQPGSVPA